MDWVTCAHSAACTALARQPYGICLFHLSPEQRTAALLDIQPGRLLDLRGTTLDGALLTRVLEAAAFRPGRTRLEHATFTGEAKFAGVSFEGDLSLDGARFERLASFFDVRFHGNVSMSQARFARELSFHGAVVRGHATLDGALMARDALFSETVFGRGLSCERARFDGFATFDGARFGDTANFRGARFGRTLSFRKVAGPATFEAAHFAADAYLSGTGRLWAAHARADATLDVSVSDCVLNLRQAEVAGPVLVRLADSCADLSEAVLHGPATVTGRGTAALTSLRGVVAPSLTLLGLDLTTCRFAGLAHPSGLRLKECTFAFTPRGVRLSLRWPPLRWFSRRRALADEHGWRGWIQSPSTGESTSGELAALYASLREGLDDSGTAADFAFGAMEMRRQASRRWWLSLYWLVCGYGMRMGRAAAWSVLLVALTAGAMLWTTTSHASRRPSHRPPPPPTAPR